MAYGTKYYFIITDFIGSSIRVKLKLKDYSGSSTQLQRGGVSFEFGAGRAVNVVRGSSATIGLWCETQGQFSEFRAVTDRKWTVEVLKDNNPLWIGYITPEVFSEPFKKSFPYRIEITAMDGLGDLKNIPYRLNETTRYTGISTFQTVIERCLNAVGFGINTVFSCGLRPFGSSGNVFQYCALNNDSLIDSNNEPLNCYDVLERFNVLGITVKQWGSKWYVIRTEDLVNGTITCYENNGVGMYSATMNDAIGNPGGAGCFVVNQSGTISQNPAVKKVKAEVNYGLRKSMLKNYNFSDPGVGWTFAGDTIQYLSQSGKTYGFLSGMDLQGLRTGMEQTIAVSFSNKVTTFSFKVAPIAGILQGSGNMSRIVPFTNINILAQIYIDDGTTRYYLDTTNGWVTSSSTIMVAVPSTAGSDINWNEIKVIAASIPLTGNLTITLYKLMQLGYQPYWRIYGIAYTDVIITGEASDFPDKETIEKVSNNLYNYLPAVSKLELCDAPQLENSLLSYNNCILNQNGQLTTAWRDDKLPGEFTIQNLFVNHYIRNFSIATRLISVIVRGILRPIGTLSYEGSFYEVVSSKYEPRNSEWQVELRELLAFPPHADKLSAYFYRIEEGVIYDIITGNVASDNGYGSIALPALTGNDLFNFGLSTYWNVALLTWYNSLTPRICPFTFLIKSVWYNAATASTRARLFMRDYSSGASDLMPMLVYNQNLTTSEQNEVNNWLLRFSNI